MNKINLLIDDETKEVLLAYITKDEENINGDDISKLKEELGSEWTVADIVERLNIEVVNVNSVIEI